VNQTKKFLVGDLVVFKSISPSVMKYQIGIIISADVLTKYQKKENIKKQWYSVQFGDVKLVVSADMIDKVNQSDE
jgi:hypothetical protein